MAFGCSTRYPCCWSYLLFFVLIFYWFFFLKPKYDITVSLFWFPAFLLYIAAAMVVSFFLIFYCAPRYGQTNIFVYIGICSIIGSLTVSDSSYPIHLVHSNNWQSSVVELIFSFMHLNDQISSLCLSQVMSVKAIGIAIKLTLDGSNQFVYFQTWIFIVVGVSCIVTNLNYLNMVSIILSIFMWLFFGMVGFQLCVSSAFL